MFSRQIAAAAVLAALALPFAIPSAHAAPPTIRIEKKGVERTMVSIELAASTPAEKAFVKSLERNLQISGSFLLGPRGSVKITGRPGAGVNASGKGKSLTTNATFTDEKSARMAARRFADALSANFADEPSKGFAQDRLVVVNRLGADNADMYTIYPDGFDFRCVSREGHAIVGPRWAPNGTDIYYTGFLDQTPLIYRLDTLTGRRSKLASFKGLATGCAISPDGSRAAMVLSFQGNPELYVMDFATKRVRRLTRTRNAVEASPAWSPDGSKIAYVSDETRQPQIYILDLATGKSTRFTRTGTQNTNPAWAANGLLAWATKRAGTSYIAVADPAKGEASARLVTSPGSWESPSWASDSRHIAASRDKAIFLIDAHPDADTPPIQIFRNQGNWMNPSFTRR